MPWDLDTPHIVELLDQLQDTDVKDVCFDTTNALVRPCRRAHAGATRDLTAQAAKLLVHSWNMLMEAMSAPRPHSQAQVARLRRAVILHHLMPPLITTTDGAAGASRFERVAMLCRGELTPLVGPLLAHGHRTRKPKPPAVPPPDKFNDSIVKLVSMRGGLRKAAQRLENSAAARPDDACLGDMQAKHPQPFRDETVPQLLEHAEVLLRQAPAELPSSLRELQESGFSTSAIANCIRLASPLSGPGPSGLRYSHLQWAMTSDWGHGSVPAALSKLCKSIVCQAGVLPPLFWQLHTGARLTPLAEASPEGAIKHRPIACGEVLQRLTASVYVRDRKGYLTTIMEPHGQFGVATPAGAERAAMAGKVAHESGEWLLSLDLRNAFNCVSLRAMAAFVARDLPDLLPYFVATYVTTRPHLLFRHQDGQLRTICSQRGVKQGDPLGPVLFCGGISSSLSAFNTRATEQQSSRRIVAYMDDAQVHVGSSELSEQDLHEVGTLKQAFAEVGLEMNLAKCFALPGRDHAVLEAERDLTQQLGIKLVGDQDMAERGCRLLGVPVGSDQFVAVWLEQQMAPDSSHTRVMTRCAQLTSARAAYTILRYSLVPRMDFLLRTVPPDQVGSLAAQWDQRAQWVLECSMGLQGEGGLPTHSHQFDWDHFVDGGMRFVLSGEALAQARLPTRHGGVGIKSAVALAPAAYVAGCAASLPGVLSMRKSARGEGNGLATDPHLPLLRACVKAIFALRTAQADALPLKSLPAAFAVCESETHVLDLNLLEEGAKHGSLQQALSHSAAKVAATALLSKLQEYGDLRTRLLNLARFRALTAKDSIGAAFLNEAMGRVGVPAFDGLPFQLALLRVLGVERAVPQCGLCNKVPGGTLHARFCQHAQVKGHDSMVHNRMARALKGLCQQYLSVPVGEEDRSPFIGADLPTLRMDLTLPSHAFPNTSLEMGGHGKSTLVDVSHVELQCATHVAQASQDPSQCCASREATKRDHYSPHFDGNCYNLATVAIGSFGCVGKQAAGLFKSMATEWAYKVVGDPKLPRFQLVRAVALARIRGRMSLALHAGLSGRVMAYMSAPNALGPDGGVGPGMGDQLLDVVGVEVGDFGDTVCG